MKSFCVVAVWLLVLTQMCAAVKFRDALVMQKEGLNLRSTVRSHLKALLRSKDAKQRAKTIIGLEKMVGTLILTSEKAQEAGDNVSDSVKQTVGDIKELVTSMLNATQEQHDLAEAACNDTFTNISTCDSAYTAGTTDDCPSNLPTLRSDHETCRTEQAVLELSNQTCQNNLSSIQVRLDNATTAFNEVNGTHNGEEYCEINQNEQDANQVKEYLERMITKHETDAQTYLDRKWEFGNVTDEFNQQNVICNGIIANLTTKQTNCSQDQLDFENAACEVHRDRSVGCAAYYTCYDTKKDEHEAQVNLSIAMEPGLKAEWRALKRIGCLLDAFDSFNISAEIETCIAAKHDLSPMNITCSGAPQRFNVSCEDGCIANPSNLTGSFKADEYEQHDWTDLVDECGATCCVV
eukprot:TRINITY_DN16263_c0_g2_i1.p1 TRINITY_DN16263_c0_g2~~TRINITY_DN16263_c0_g2_i1.p1  ORF type:complete len:407 (-),score=76.77 TRINITY_DN16263_c0_g2_i1:59-1279(-)